MMITLNLLFIVSVSIIKNKCQKAVKPSSSQELLGFLFKSHFTPEKGLRF